MKILALDLGKFNSVACCFNAKTRKSKFVTTPTKREYFAEVSLYECCNTRYWACG